MTASASRYEAGSFEGIEANPERAKVRSAESCSKFMVVGIRKGGGGGRVLEDGASGRTTAVLGGGEGARGRLLAARVTRTGGRVEAEIFAMIGS